MWLAISVAPCRPPVVGFHDDHAGPSLLGRDADDGDRDADERGDADGDQRAGHELKARGVLGGARAATAGAPAASVALGQQVAIGVVVDRVGLDDVGIGRQERLAGLGQQRGGIVLGLRARRVPGALAELALVVRLAHTLGQMLSSRTSMTGARGAAASSSSTTSSP